MASSLANIKALAKFAATIQNTLDDSSVVSKQETLTVDPTFATGTGAGQVDRGWIDTARTLTSGNSEDLDVFDLAAFDIGAGAGLDALGQSMTLVEVAVLIVVNLSTSVGDLLVGGKGTTAAWNSIFNGDDDAKLLLPPDSGTLFWTRDGDNWAVADTSNHLLTLEASGGDVNYQIGLLGRDS